MQEQVSPKASERTAQRSERPWRELFYSMASPACLLGHDGGILEVNRAWGRFMMLNGGASETCGVGANYLTVCDAAEDPTNERSIGFQLRQVLNGRSEGFEFAYPCHSPTERRWYIACIRSVREAKQIWVLVEHHDVTAPQLALEISRAEHERFEALFRYTINAVFLVDDMGFCHEGNPTACNLLGISQELIKSLDLGVRIEAPGLEGKFPWNSSDRVALVREPVRLRRMDNSALTAECSTVCDIQSGLHLVVLQDITEQDRANRLARETIERYDLLVDGIQDGVWDWDLASGRCFFSPHWFAMRGLQASKEVLNPELLCRAVHPDDLPSVVAAVSDHLAGRTTMLDADYRVRIPGAGLRWIQDRGKVSHDANGRAIRFIGVSSDVTNRKAAETMLAQREAELRDSQRLGRIGDWSLELETGRLRCSDELLRMLGVDATSPPSSWDELQNHFVAESWEVLRRAQEDLVQHGYPYALELMLPFQPDGCRWVEARAEVVSSSADRISRVRGTLLDLSERHRADQAVQSQRNAEQANRAKSVFLSRMSHELRTPLNAVLGFAQLLRLDSKCPLNEDQLKQVDQITTAGKHLLHLINDLLDISLIESGGLRLKIESVDLVEVVREAVATVSPDADRLGVSVKFQQDCERLDLLADKVRLRQVLLNLLSNAIKYNQQGGHVLVDANRVGDRLQTRVRDNGWGMTADQQALLFEQFNRAGRENSPVPGIGLGLAICKQLVSMMGGSISVVSVSGAGSEFILEFPLASS